MISIIVPVYNAEKYIDRCIRSVLLQTFNDFELILVDDGSSDASLHICKSYANESEKITLVSQSNSGVSAARNKGLSVAKGEYVLFVDSDDALEINACETLINHQNTFNDDCVIYGFRQLSGNIWAPEYDKHYSSLAEFKKDYPYWLNTELLSSSVNKLYKREKVDVLFPDHMAFGEDLVFSLNYLSACQTVSFIQAPLYIHDNLNVSSLSHSFNLNRFRDVEIIQGTILSFADNKDANEVYSKYMNDCVRIVRDCLKMATLSFQKKKSYLYSWLSISYLLSLCLKAYPMDWRNYLMMFFFKNRMLYVSYLIVNGKRIIKSLVD